jgi:hypothetical protein
MNVSEARKFRKLYGLKVDVAKLAKHKLECGFEKKDDSYDKKGGIGSLSKIGTS